MSFVASDVREVAARLYCETIALLPSNKLMRQMLTRAESENSSFSSPNQHRMMSNLEMRVTRDEVEKNLRCRVGWGLLPTE